MGEKFNVEEREYTDVSVGILDVKVLITLMKLERYNQSQFVSPTSLHSRECKLEKGGMKWTH